MKMVFPKNTLECDIFGVIGKGGISFSQKYSFRTENERGYSHRGTLSSDIFCIIGKDNISFFLYDIKGVELRQD